MTKWPSNWQNATLTQSGIELTQFAKDVMSLWEASTPTEPWSNNPIGMPAKGFSPRAIPNTRYALFSTMPDYRQSFVHFLLADVGAGVRHAIVAQNGLSDVWREIHALGWPANDTESDYPAAILDRLETTYQEKAAARTSGKRKSSGVTTSNPGLVDRVVSGHHIMRQAMEANLSAAERIAKILKETK